MRSAKHINIVTVCRVLNEHKNPNTRVHGYRPGPLCTRGHINTRTAGAFNQTVFTPRARDRPACAVENLGFERERDRERGEVILFVLYVQGGPVHRGVLTKPVTCYRCQMFIDRRSDFEQNRFCSNVSLSIPISPAPAFCGHNSLPLSKNSNSNKPTLRHDETTSG